MIYRLLFIFISLCIFSCSHPKYKNPHIVIKTKFGNITVELYPDKAPKTVAAFLSYVDSGFYKNGLFYRVLKEEDQPSSSFKSELIQGGIWQTNSKKALRLAGIEHESTKQTGILHTNGTISLARTAPGTANTEFFICVGDQPAYNYKGIANPDGQGYAAFGRVVKGMEVVRAIHHQPNNEDALTPPVEIFNIIKL